MKSWWVPLLIVPLAGCVGDDVDDLEARMAVLESEHTGMAAELAELQAGLDEALADLGNMSAAALVVDFGATGDNETWTSVVVFDARDRPSESSYQAEGAAHPDMFTAHDLIDVWASAQGHTYNVTWFAFGSSGGFFLDDVGGVSAAGHYWAVGINGDDAAVGMSELQVASGSTITLTLKPF